MTETDNRNSHRWIMFSIISLVYFFVYFHRVSTSVIAPDILKAFNTNATALGFMTSMYFYLYALEQPLVGYFTDRIGARRVIAYGTMIAALGCFIFAFAPDMGWASAGRALIGIGVGCVYVPAVKAFSQWFKSNEFATMMGLLIAVGNFGAMIATTPLAWVAGKWGWQAGFNVIGFVSLILALAALFFLKDAPEHLTEGAGNGLKQVQNNSVRTSFYEPLFTSRFWIIAFTFLGAYGIVLTFQGLWATPFLMSAFGLDKIAASQLNMLIPIGFIIGSPLFGRLADRVFKSKVQAINVLLAMLALSWAGIVFGIDLGRVFVSISLFLMGVSMGGFVTNIWAHVREITPPQTLGSFSGLLNPAPFVGGAVFQVLTGSLLDRAVLPGGIYPASAYQSSFVFCLVVSCLCLVLSFFMGRK